MWRAALVPSLALLLLLSTACQAPRPTRSASASREGTPPLRMELPASLADERGAYEREVLAALKDVSRFFRSAGLDGIGGKVIGAVRIFESATAARETMAKEAGVPLEALPETFSGTVDGERLFLVSRESYRRIWGKLYPDWPWTEKTYHQLIVHELAHRAHEMLAIARYGSADAMGPPWFFEGLAVACAGQFESEDPPMRREEIEGLVGPGRTPKVSYPLYGRIVRSLAAEFGMRDLVARAAEPGFPETLWPPSATARPKEEQGGARGERRTSVSQGSSRKNAPSRPLGTGRRAS